MKFNIIIPYYNMDEIICNQLYNTLFNQSIINECNIILISDNSFGEDLVKEKFKNFPNTFFERNEIRSGAGVARNKGINLHLSGAYTLFLDADDYFINSECLLNIYKELEESNANILYHIAYSDLEQDNLIRKLQIVIKSDFLYAEDFKFLPLFMNEFLIFQAILSSNKGSIIKYSEYNYVIYKLKDNSHHFTQEIMDYDTLYANFGSIVGVMTAFNFSTEEELIDLYIKKMLEMYQEFKTNKVLLFYCLYKMYLKYPKNFEEVYSSLEISDNLINKIKKSDMTIILETQILKTEKDIKEYIKNFIILHSNVFFIFPSLITIDNLLEIGAYDN